MTTLVFETTIFFCEKILLQVVLVWQNKKKQKKIKTVFLALWLLEFSDCFKELFPYSKATVTQSSPGE